MRRKWLLNVCSDCVVSNCERLSFWFLGEGGKGRKSPDSLCDRPDALGSAGIKRSNALRLAAGRVLGVLDLGFDFCERFTR